MDWFGNGYNELVNGRLFDGRLCADGAVGKEEGESVPKGIWRQVQEEEIRSDAWHYLSVRGFSI